ncbi:MAG: hypothetical protein LBP81_06795, partial [Treponema sp.]|nr:hypothetical protein [Treponema sp.]
CSTGAAGDCLTEEGAAGWDGCSGGISGEALGTRTSWDPEVSGTGWGECVLNRTRAARVPAKINIPVKNAT